MFREMRRKNQALSQEECISILQNTSAGVLALEGDDGYPYALPISYVYHDGKLYFHCAKAGHKLDALKRNEKVSFCVIERDDVKPEEFTSYFRSVIVFGKAHVLEEDLEKRAAIETLAAKYAPHHQEEGMKEIDREWNLLCMIELCVEHISGKEAIELKRLRKYP